MLADIKILHFEEKKQLPQITHQSEESAFHWHTYL